MKLRFTPRAVQDLIEIARYLHAGNPVGARRVRAALTVALRQLARFPRSGRSQRTHGVRKLAIKRYPYLLYYRIDTSTDEVIVLTVQHAARRREHQDD
jgi:addiction module RelE/StbE family toxin